MKTFKHLRPVLLAVLAIVLVQCARREQDVATEKTVGKMVEISASLEQPQGTKTTLSSENKVLWSEGDKIRVYNASHPSGVEYTLSSGAGTSLGKFSGEEVSGDGPFFAVYPSSVGGSLSGESVSVTLPARQRYAQGSFGPGAAVSFAMGSTPSSLIFKNVLGGVSFSVSGSQAFSGIRLQTKGKEALAGNGSVRMVNGVPELTFPAQVSDDDSFLYLDMPEGGATAATFYLMLPPGVFNSGFMVEFLDSDGNVMFRSAKATVNTVTRSSILDMPQITYTPMYKAAFFESDSFGYFQSVGVPEELQALKFDPVTGQYAYRTDTERYVRVQSLSQGFKAEITTPKDLVLGQTYEVSVSILQGRTETSLIQDFKVLAKTADRVWLVNDEDQVGIIQKLED